MSLLVNGEYVDGEVVREEAAMVRAKLVEAMVDEDPLALELRAREWARENVIERVLLRQAAMLDTEPVAGEDGKPLPPAEEARVRVQRLIARVTAGVPPPGRKEVAEFYRANRESFRTPELIRAAHIVKNVDEQNTEEAALEAITKVRDLLMKGRKFAEAADEFSDCPGRGGDLGYFPRGQMVEEFDAVVFAQKPRQIGQIFRTPFGFHIAYVLERKPEGIRELSEVRADIEKHILDARREKALEDHVDALRAKADIRKAPAAMAAASEALQA